MNARSLLAAGMCMVGVVQVGCAHPPCRCECSGSADVRPAGVPPELQPRTAVLQSCVFAPVVPGCRSLPVTGATGSHRYLEERGSEDSDFAKAIDGDRCTMWNAGDFPPQEIELDLGVTTNVHALVLLPAMLPDGPQVIEISVWVEGQGWWRVLRGKLDLQSNVPVTLRFPQPAAGRRLRIRTLSSPSWAAWLEIVPLQCS